MKFSQFNVVSEYLENILIFNTWTTAFIKITKENWKKLLNFVNNTDIENSLPTKIIDQLVKSGIICEDSKDELLSVKHRFFSNMYSNQVLNLSIAPTMECNFDCFYCFEQGNKNFGKMSDETADALVKYISIKSRNRKVFIHWFGGEPLLGFTTIKYICERLRENDIEFRSSMISNGSLFTEENIKNLDLLNLDFIQISMDGTAKDHDRRRCFKNGKPSFDIIIRNIKNILELTDIKICVQATVDHSNETGFKDLKQYIKENFTEFFKTKRIRIGKNYVQDRIAFDIKGTCFTPDQILQEEIASLSSSSSSSLKRRVPDPCMPCMYRCFDSFAIDSRGYIYQCLEHMGNIAHNIGNINAGLISADKLISMSWSNLPFDDDECKQCAYLPICLGGCPIDRNKKLRKEIDTCCCNEKYNLVKLLPYIYENQYQHHEN